MTDRQVFGLLVRVIGMLAAVYGFMDLGTGLFRLVTPPSGMPETWPTGAYFLAGSIATLAGILLVRGKWLVLFAYGRES